MEAFGINNVKIIFKQSESILRALKIPKDPDEVVEIMQDEGAVPAVALSSQSTSSSNSLETPSSSLKRKSASPLRRQSRGHRGKRQNIEKMYEAEVIEISSSNDE